MNKKIEMYITIVLLIVMYTPIASEALEVKTQNLQSELVENNDINFDIDISDYGYASYISIETNIVKNGNEPIFDFGELNEKYVGTDRYKQKVIIDVPKDINDFKIKISGKSPNGIDMSKVGNVEIAKFIDENQKYYEVKLLGENKEDLGANNKQSKLFKLIINEKISFEKELKNVKSDDLEVLKGIAIDMFNRGLITDAKKIVSALEVITPESQILPYKEVWKNVGLGLIIVILCIFFYLQGQKQNDEDQ